MLLSSSVRPVSPASFSMAPTELYHLGVDGGVPVADGLGPELVELTVSAGLWAVVPVHWDRRSGA